MLGGASPTTSAVAPTISTLLLAAALPNLSLSFLGLQARSWFLSLTNVSFGVVLGPPPGFHGGSSLLRRRDLNLLLGGDLDLRSWYLYGYLTFFGLMMASTSFCR